MADPVEDGSVATVSDALAIADLLDLTRVPDSHNYNDATVRWGNLPLLWEALPA